ncbi:hypothetical protein [Microbispora siamensis]|uniref:Uncharacterized protein n=1 Tax=Microbispora siamensis TaxID=564413 RepID=A0ABQ4GRK9_9ACTN|nr:hypothetical protein [Microbispora siamensis]GIH63989.1 hypothetical protein Msi02_48060 [Microbispora siamensis]
MELFIALLVAALVIAAISRKRNPLKVCPTCKGTGVLRSGMWAGRYRPCPRCDRKGEISTR